VLQILGSGGEFATLGAQRTSREPGRKKPGLRFDEPVEFRQRQGHFAFTRQRIRDANACGGVTRIRGSDTFELGPRGGVFAQIGQRLPAIERARRTFERQFAGIDAFQQVSRLTDHQIDARHEFRVRGYRGARGDRLAQILFRAGGIAQVELDFGEQDTRRQVIGLLLQSVLQFDHGFAIFVSRDHRCGARGALVRVAEHIACAQPEECREQRRHDEPRRRETKGSAHSLTPADGSIAATR